MPAEPAARHRLHEHPVATSRSRATSRRARTSRPTARSTRNAGGEHQFKFGVQADRVGNDVLSGESRNRVTHPLGHRARRPACRSARHLRLLRGAQQRRRPEEGFITEGNIHTNNIGLFVQDAWTINNRLTVNAGLRTERERRADLHDGRGHPGVRHRVRLRATSWRRASASPTTSTATASGRCSARGACSTTSSSWSCRAARSAATSGSTYYYTLDTLDWPNLLRQLARCPPACPGTLIRGPIDFRHPSFGSDSHRPGPEADAAAGSHRRPRSPAERRDGGRASATSTSRSTARSKTRARSTPDGNEIYIIANPGEGLTALAFTDPERRAAEAEARLRQRRVRAREAVRQQLVPAHAATCGAGSTATTRACRSRTRTAAPARTSAALFDYPMMMFQDGGTPAYGPLATDRPHQFKTQFIYQFPFGTSVGREPVRGERPAGDAARSASTRPATTRCSTWAAAATAGRRRSRRPTCYVQHSFQHRRQPAAAAQLQRAEPVQPGHGGQQVLDLSEDVNGVDRRTRRSSTLASRRSSS